MTVHSVAPVDTQCSRSCQCSAFALRVLRHIRVQTACPERTVPLVWQALAGGRAARCAAPPGHRISVPSGRGQVQGKIKGRGTPAREKSVCTWGWRGTRWKAAPCRARQQGRVRTGETACFARAGALIFAGAAA